MSSLFILQILVQKVGDRNLSVIYLLLSTLSNSKPPNRLPSFSVGVFVEIQMEGNLYSKVVGANFF